MKKHILIWGLGLLPLWLATVMAIVGLLVGEPEALVLLIPGGMASVVTLPIVLATAAAYRFVAGGSRRKRLTAAAAGGLGAIAVVALLIYRSDVMTGRREARVDLQLALEYARNSDRLADVAGGRPVEVRINGITDNRMSRSFFLAPLEYDPYAAVYHPTSYQIEARGKRLVYATVMITRADRGPSKIEMNCCRNDRNTQFPYRSDY